MVPKTERIELRLDPELVGRLDDWIGRQSGMSGRSEAIRQMIEDRLSTVTGAHFLPTNSEKLMVHLLTELLKDKDKRDRTDVDFIQDAMIGGHYWALEWKLSGIFHDHVDSRSTLAEVVDILDMWDFIEKAYAGFDERERAEVLRVGGDYAKDPQFLGFDGNHEGEYVGIAFTLINKMERFQHFKGRNLNSHSGTAARYREMAKLFQPMRNKLAQRGAIPRLNAEQVGQLLQLD